MRVNTDRMWDLSQPVAHNGPSHPSQPPPDINRDYRRAVEGSNVETVRLTTHTGTHVDAPPHFDQGERTIDQMPLEAFAGPVEFLDLRELVEPGRPIAADLLRPLLDPLRPGDFAVLATGWGARRSMSEDFLKRWPYLDGAGARLLLERQVAGVGVDTLSIGGLGPHEEPSHLVLLSAGTVIIEDLRVPDELLGRRCFLTAFPVLLEGCGGAWARAVAWAMD